MEQALYRDNEAVSAPLSDQSSQFSQLLLLALECLPLPLQLVEQHRDQLLYTAR
jgi:hypothetical protein